MDWLLSTPIAHRGLHDDSLPENSLSAYSEAIKNGFNIEIDVHLSLDKKIVVFHDDNLKRVTGVDRNISDLTLAELKDLRLCGTDQTIPTFDEVLDLVDGKVGLLIEIKNEGKVGELEQKVYDRLKSYHGNYAIQGFNPFVVKWYREHAPEVRRGILSCTFHDNDLAWYKKFLLRNLLLYPIMKPDFISYDETALPRFAVKTKKVPVLAWTVRSDARARELLSKKTADNIIFENFVPKKSK